MSILLNTIQQQKKEWVASRDIDMENSCKSFTF